mmetsp:Transcript_15425/g.22720  ORF Transcript_15425/g.22720 Transcript_15425/m.22720 type:complete len:336 (-) Transcript_15425:35-1042(-)
MTHLSIFLLVLSSLAYTANALAKPSAASRLQNLYRVNRQTSASSSPASAIILPGVHDALSAKIYSDAGAKVLFLSGFGVSACKLGQPDVGILTLTEMEDALRSVVQAAAGTPVIVDGDTGYGGAVNVRRTVRAFARAGAAALTIEDQVFPKKCTYAAGKGVRTVSRQECGARMKAALEARNEARDVDGNDILIVARTDCRAALGFEEALERCKLFEELGADICYAENLQSRQEYDKLRSQLLPSTATILAQVETGNEEQTLYSAQNIAEMKYDFALLGVTALQAYVRSLEMSASLMMAPNSSGFVKSNLDVASFNDLKASIGFEDSESFQARHDC